MKAIDNSKFHQDVGESIIMWNQVCACLRTAILEIESNELSALARGKYWHEGTWGKVKTWLYFFRHICEQRNMQKKRFIYDRILIDRFAYLCRRSPKWSFIFNNSDPDIIKILRKGLRARNWFAHTIMIPTGDSVVNVLNNTMKNYELLGVKWQSRNSHKYCIGYNVIISKKKSIATALFHMSEFVKFPSPQE